MTQVDIGGDFGGELLSTSIKQYLLDRIIGGQYAPGERIIELRLAKELGTSQSPVREALRELAAIGLVEINPRRGTRVRMPTNKELVDVSVVRSVLDALAAELAAEIINESTLDELEALLDEMSKCIAAKDFRRMALADARFHGRIARASGNVAVQRVFEHLEPFGRTYLTLSLPNVDVDELMREHSLITSALRDGDGPRAAEAARQHQLSVSRLLCDDVRPGD